MRVEHQHGNYILCGHILPVEKIKPGQVWQDSSGRTVTVTDCTDGLVFYIDTNRGQYIRESFAFQCRYCLVLPSAEIPEELK